MALVNLSNVSDGRPCFVTCGHNTTAFITTTGQLYLCGKVGEIGGEFPSLVPVDNKKVRNVACGFAFMVIVTGTNWIDLI